MKRWIIWILAGAVLVGITVLVMIYGPSRLLPTFLRAQLFERRAKEALERERQRRAITKWQSNDHMKDLVEAGRAKVRGSVARAERERIERDLAREISDEERARRFNERRRAKNQPKTS